MTADVEVADVEVASAAGGSGVPASMRAVVLRAFGDGGLGLEQVPTPGVVAGEALVAVAAVEVSRTRDLATASGLHPFSRQVRLPHVLGGDCAAEAAALAATGPVALTQLRAGGVGPGTVVLVPGVTGALGSTLVALCAALGARAVGISRRPSEAGGHPVVDARSADLPAAIMAATGGAAPRAVIDDVCSPRVFGSYFPVLAQGARVVVSGAIGDPGPPVLPVPARDLYSRSISVLGVRSHVASATADLWEMVRGGFRLPREAIHLFPLERVGEAHEAVRAGTAVGHTVLAVPGAGARDRTRT